MSTDQKTPEHSCPIGVIRWRTVRLNPKSKTCPERSRRIQNPKSRSAFSLVELLVVIGVISVVISMLLPALTSARRQADAVKCKTQLRDIGVMLLIYANINDGWLFPVGDWVENHGPNRRNTYRVFGTNKHPAYRWPMLVFQFSHPPVPSPEPAERQGWTYEEIRPFNPPILMCPADQETPYGHSYVLNAHLVESKDQVIKAGSKIPGGRSTAEVVWMGEKRTEIGDYFMQKDEFERVVAPYRHGLNVGSNYLYLDGHVSMEPPEPVKIGLDPWEVVPEPEPPAQPE